MKAILRRVRISPKKANLVAELVRNKPAIEAVNILKYTPKKASEIIRKVIESAMANAETNFKQKKENLFIKEIIVNEGTTYKRSIPISRGRTHPILKRTSHITVKVEAIKAVEEKKEAKTAEKKDSKDSAKTEEVKSSKTPKKASVQKSSKE